MSERVENGAVLAEYINTTLNNAIVHFDYDEGLSVALCDVKYRSESPESNRWHNIGVCDAKAAFVLGKEAKCFRINMKTGKDDSLAYCKFNVGGVSYSDPLKEYVVQNTDGSYTVNTGNDPGFHNYSENAKKDYNWLFFKNDTTKTTTTADLIAICGDLTSEDLIECVIRCLSRVINEGRMPRENRESTHKYNYIGKIGAVRVDDTDIPFYLVGFSITQNVEKVEKAEKTL